MRVDSVGTGGYITGVTVSGTAPDGTATYNAVAASGGAGSSATFDVTRTGSTYTANINNAGTNYVGGNSLTILGNVLGGATPANDCTISVDSVDGSGVIQTITASGAAANVGSVDNLSSENIIGSGATFDVALASGSYTVTIAGAGQNYYDDQTFTVLGTDVAGSTPANDVTIIITNTGASNAITSVSSSGTGSTDVASFDYITVSNASATGNAATFNIVRDGTLADSSVGTYNITGSNPGNGYSVGNRLAINGGTVGGTPTVNDIEITVDSVDSAGAIVTFSATGDAYAGDDFALYSTITVSYTHLTLPTIYSV